MPSELPSPTSLILVVLFKEPRDREIAHVLGWYRVPLRSAPKVIAVDYLAFYQTAAFGEERWRIQYVAEVLGHELTTRGELLRDEPDHPHAHQEYYKIQIGPLQRLPQEILAESWRRITFLYTTGDYLLQARTINDLIVPNDARPILWNALRERLSQAEIYQSIPEEQILEIDLDPAILAALLGISEIEEPYQANQNDTHG